MNIEDFKLPTIEQLFLELENHRNEYVLSPTEDAAHDLLIFAVTLSSKLTRQHVLEQVSQSLQHDYHHDCKYLSGQFIEIYDKDCSRCQFDMMLDHKPIHLDITFN